MNITADLKLEGKKVRVTIRFRGREITYPEIALEDLREVTEELADIAVIEQPPAMEGKVMTMLLSPTKYMKKKTESGKADEPEKPGNSALPVPTSQS